MRKNGDNVEKSNDNIFKKLFRVFHSMKFGIILLLIIGVFSIIGTLIPQNQTEAYYIANYKGIIAELIISFDLNKLYSSFWYVALMVLLIINLFLCSVKRFVPIFKRVTEKPNFGRIIEDYENWELLNIEEGKLESFAEDLGFKKLETKVIDGRRISYQYKNSIGHLGSWLTHISLIIIILAFAFGRTSGYEVYIYGVPGTVRTVENTDYEVRIDDFEMRLDENMAVSQYVTSLTLIKDGQILDSGQTMVNYPYRAKGINIYQNSTGWALNVSLLKDGEAYKKRILYNSEFFVEDNEKIALQFVNFFPDFDMSNPSALRNLSPLLKHPVMLYALFYEGKRVDMGLAHMGGIIEYKEYKFVVDRPEMYTLLQINYDPAIAFAALGGFLQVLGMILAFYLRSKKIRIVCFDDKAWMWTKSYGNDNLYREEVNNKIKKWEEI